MIIPSIDIMNGQAVQLVEGRTRVLDAGDPRPLAERFGRVGEVAVVDLDAALGSGDNTALIRDLLRRARCRVGGGIRDAAAARRWLDEGAVKIVLGTAATPEVLERLPRERIIAALDARHGEVMTHGWRQGTGAGIEARLDALTDLVGGFLVTFIEREGHLGGGDLERAAALARRVPGCSFTAAGGITTAAEVADLDGLGIDAQVGMALYTGRLHLADALTATLTCRHPDGLWPTVVADAGGTALGLCWSSRDSVRQALDSGRGVYESRRRGLWIKGETSGATQDLLAVDADCDRDTLRFTVRQHGAGFCHQPAATCWGADAGLTSLARRLGQIKQHPEPDSYTARLLGDETLLAAKLAEEAGELAAARQHSDVVWEAADLFYFTVTAMTRAGVSLEEVELELDRRALRLSRKASS